MPTDNQTHVLNFLHAITGIPAAQIEANNLDTALKDPPLSMDDPSLAFLASMVRAYIQNINPAQTFFVQEARTPGLTVRGLIDLVNVKIP